MSDEGMVTFKFPRELVKNANPGESPDYWWGLFCDDDFSAKTKLECLLYTRVLEWQEANRLKVTPETPNGTEVEIVGEPQLVPVFLVGPDPLDPDDYVVIVTAEGKLFSHKWEELRLVELVRKEGSDD